MPDQPIPHGYCRCGCGQKTKLAARTDPRHGHVKGEPVRFLKAHHHRGKVVSAATRAKLSAAAAGERGAAWRGDDAGYRAIHAWLCVHCPKSGICQSCGERAPTEYALIHGERHARDRARYRELCKGCHLRYDDPNRNEGRGGSSRFRGVSWDKRRRLWRAYAGHRHLGRYATEEEAAEIAAAARRVSAS